MNESDFGLAGIDTTIVLLYLVGVLGIGTYFGRFVKNAGDFFIAGKAQPFWAVGMSIVVSDRNRSGRCTLSTDSASSSSPAVADGKTVSPPATITVKIVSPYSSAARCRIRRFSEPA